MFRRNLMQFLMVGIALAALVVAGCEKKQEAPTEVVIGATISQSGPFQGVVKPFGDLANAWIETVNERGGIEMGGSKVKLRMVLYDDQSSPPEALKFYERLATVDNVDLFLGPFTSFITNAALQASVTHKKPFFMVEANDSVMFETPNEWRATGLAPAALEYKRVADLYAKKGGVKRFALVSRDNLHENQAMEGFGEALTAAGFEVVYKEILPKDIKDFSSVILAIKQTNPDVVFLEAIPPPFTIGFLKQARELGLNPKDIVSGHTPVPVIKAMAEAGENIVSAIYSFDGDSADHQEFKALAGKAGFEPWQYSESGIRYVTYKRIEDALKRAGSTDPEAVRKAMWDADFTLYGGELHVKQDEKGYGTLHPWPAQIQGGKLVSLWPLDAGVERHKFKDGKW